jgi:hypothetical protein
MLAFDHIPTGNTGHGVDIDEVNGGFLKPAVTTTAIGPTSKPAGLHLNNRLRLSHDRGPPHSTALVTQSDAKLRTSIRKPKTANLEL